MKIITTIGPKSLNQDIISKLELSGADYFRINLSHSDKSSLAKYFQIISNCGVRPSIDTQGAQIRLLNTNGIDILRAGEDIVVCGNKSTENFDKSLKQIYINHSEVFSQITSGSKLRIDFDGAVIELISVYPDESYALARVITSGSIQSNRAIDVIDQPIKLKSLTELDVFAIKKYAPQSAAIFLSFTNSGKDIDDLNALLDCINCTSRPLVYAKIESKMGIYNIETILPKVDGILIDRGDLSREISISYIPVATHSLIALCHKYNKPCFIATNILDSMMTSTLPSRAEVSDLYNLYSMGVGGIVLASEVAIGNNPIDSVRVVKYIHDVYRSASNSLLAFVPSVQNIRELPPHLAEWL